MNAATMRQVLDVTGLSYVIWFAVMLTSCGENQPTRATDVPIWELSERLQIGVVEGDPAYEFSNVVSSLALPDGGYLVADGGSQELRYFDDSGMHTQTVGGRGAGPGEFQRLTRVYQLGVDSLLIFDPTKPGLGVYDREGVYGRVMPIDSLSGDTVFPLDVWLHRDFWIEGTLYAEGRAKYRRIVDALPALSDGSVWRFSRQGAAGNLWVREPFDPARDVWSWTVVNETGEPIGSVETPHTFTLLEATPERLVGVWRDANDVEFVRIYDINRQGGTRALPNWIVSAVPRADSLQETPVVTELRSMMRQIVIAQERHWMTARTYTQDITALELELAESFEVDIVFAFPMGWSAVGGYPGSGRVCGMGIGFATPPGWNEGMPSCG